MSPRQAQATLLLIALIYTRAVQATLEPGFERSCLALIAGLIVGWAWQK